MRLSKLAKDLRWFGKDVSVNGISYDSRKVTPGDLFVALRGRNTDGHLYIPEAIKKGAVALMVEEVKDYPVPYILVENTRKFLGIVSARLFGFPSRLLKTVGVTGTNGKTTTTFMIKNMLEAQGEKCGLLGTVLYCTGNDCFPASRTTPEASDIQGIMKRTLDEGGKYFVMEVSSAGIEEYRLEGTEFFAGCFTNFSREHLEYHGTIENYLNAKLKFFKNYKPKHCIINADDPVADKFKEAAGNYLTYGIKDSKVDLKAEILESSLKGTLINLKGIINEEGVWIPLPGLFNVYNFLCATSALYTLGKHQNIKELAKNIKQVPGRFQTVENNCGFTVIVDYAHTPEAMKNLLENVKTFKKGRIIIVFGAGGDRDPGKRPLFGQISEEYADIQIVTSDNPRSEDPLKIIKDILSGMSGKNAVVIPDRREAIHKAIEMAKENDIILIVGKGHEDYQEINGVRYPFSDKEVACEALKERACLP